MPQARPGQVLTWCDLSSWCLPSTGPRLGVGVDTESLPSGWDGLGLPSPSLDLGMTLHKALHFPTRSSYLSPLSYTPAPNCAGLAMELCSNVVSLLLLPPTFEVPSGTVCFRGMQLSLLLAVWQMPREPPTPMVQNPLSSAIPCQTSHLYLRIPSLRKSQVLLPPARANDSD